MVNSSCLDSGRVIRERVVGRGPSPPAEFTLGSGGLVLSVFFAVFDTNYQTSLY